MSYVKAKDYRKIANLLATSYKNLLAVYNSSTADVSEGTENTAYGVAQQVIKTVVETADNVSTSLAKDPVGSVSNDLGSTCYQFGTKFTPAAGASLFSGQFSTMLSALNNHVISRTPLITAASVTSIADYIKDHNFASTGPSDFDESLFGDISTDEYYFAQEFLDLCTAVGVTLTKSGTTGATQIVKNPGETKFFIKSI